MKKIDFENLERAIHGVSNLLPEHTDLCESVGLILLDTVDMLEAKTAKEFNKEKADLLNVINQFKHEVAETTCDDEAEDGWWCSVALEKVELSFKMRKLEAFLDQANDPEADYSLLKKQLEAMRWYYDILCERLATYNS